MKFGGTSVGDRDRVAHVAGLITRHEGPVVVVVSAMGVSCSGGDNLG